MVGLRPDEPREDVRDHKGGENGSDGQWKKNKKRTHFLL